MTIACPIHTTRRVNDGHVDTVLVERVCAGRDTPSLLNKQERDAAVALLYRKYGYGASRIALILHTSDSTASSIITRLRRAGAL